LGGGQEYLLGRRKVDNGNSALKGMFRFGGFD